MSSKCNWENVPDEFLVAYINKNDEIRFHKAGDTIFSKEWTFLELRPEPSKPMEALRFNDEKIDWSVLDNDFYEVQEIEYNARKYGIKKYTDKAKSIDGRTNWKNSIGTKNHEKFMMGCLESANRHLRKMRRGETVDEESGVEHVGFVRVNMGMYYYYFKRLDMVPTAVGCMEEIGDRL